MDVLLKCFDEESWSHHGKHYTFPPAVPYRGYELKEVTCVPRPINRPVEIWQPIASGRTLEYIAQRGIKGMVTLNGEQITDAGAPRPTATPPPRPAAASARRGPGAGARPVHRRQPGGGDPPGRAVPRRALQVVRAVRVRALRRRAGPALGHARRARPPADASRDGVAQKAWLCGPPVADHRRAQGVPGGVPGPGSGADPLGRGMPPAEFKEQLRRFAREVMPAFLDRR